MRKSNSIGISTHFHRLSDLNGHKLSASILQNATSHQSLSVSKSLLDKFLSVKNEKSGKHKSTKSLISPKLTEAEGLKKGKVMKLALKRPGKLKCQSVSISTFRSKPESFGSPKSVKASERHLNPFIDNSSVKATPKTTGSTLSIGSSHGEHFDSEVLQLELLLTDKLKGLNKNADNKDFFETQFLLYSQIFQDIVDRDKKFGSLLLKIKNVYEMWIRTFVSEKNEDSEGILKIYSEQLKQTKFKLQKCREEKKSVLRKVERLSKETFELSQKIEEIEQENEYLHSKLKESVLWTCKK